jgi:hypothetical protein
MTETMLRQLYAWHLDLLLLALMKHRSSARAESAAATGEAGSEPSLLDRQNAIFVEIAGSTANPEHVLALQALTQRLEPIQRLEELVLDDLEAETAAIAQAIHAADRKGLRRSLFSYHRRRKRVVPQLVALLRRDPPGR